MNVQLRPYQIEAMQALDAFQAKGGKRALMVLATGLGKRIMSIYHSQKFQRILFLAHTEELIEQAFDEFEKFFPFQTGIIKGPRFDIDKRIVVGSTQTMWRRLDKIDPNTFDLIIADECHHILARTQTMIIDHFNFKMLTGWTATPTRLDGLNFSGMFEEIVFNYGIEKAIPDGWLCKLDAYRIKTEIDLSKIHRVAGDFNQKELSAKVDIPERNLLVVQKYVQYAAGRQAVVYCCDIQHAIHMRDTFRNANIPCETIVSDECLCPNRKEINKAFKRGEIPVLTNVNILSEGWDYSDLGCVILARPTQSLALYIQFIGRGTRLKSSDFQWDFSANDCKIIDIVDNVGRHSLINCWELERETPIENKLFVSQERKDKIIAEKQRREAEVKERHKHDKKVNLLELPKIRISTSFKMFEPATAPQIEWLKRLGVWVEGNDYTKGQASELISNSPATANQIRALARMGYDVSKGVKYGQASIIFEELKEKKEANSNVTKMPIAQ